MQLTHVTPILNVSDVPASIAWFERLGWQRCFTWNDAGMIQAAADRDAHGPAQFGAVACGQTELFLCKDGQGARGAPPDMAAIARLPGGTSPDEDTGGVWMSWWVKTPAEVDAAHALAVKQGVAVIWPPTDEPWGCRECRIVHPDGHTFRIAAQLSPG